jgi:cytochrome c
MIGRDIITLRNALVTAADCDSLNETARGNREDFKYIKFTKDGAYIIFKGLDLTGIDQIVYAVNPKNTKGKIEVTVGSPDGRLVSSTPVVSKDTYKVAANEQWVNVKASVQGANGVGDVYFVFRGTPAVSIWNTFDLNTIYFSRNNNNGFENVKSGK